MLSYLPDEIKDFWYIRMQTNNTTPLETHFSITRVNHKDYLDLYGGEVTDKSDRSIMRELIAAISKGNSSYDADDMVEFNQKLSHTSGSTMMTAFRKTINKKEEDWKAKLATSAVLVRRLRCASTW